MHGWLTEEETQVLAKRTVRISSQNGASGWWKEGYNWEEAGWDTGNYLKAPHSDPGMSENRAWLPEHEENKRANIIFCISVKTNDYKVMPFGVSELGSNLNSSTNWKKKKITQLFDSPFPCLLGGHKNPNPLSYEVFVSSQGELGTQGSISSIFFCMGICAGPQMPRMNGKLSMQWSLPRICLKRFQSKWTLSGKQNTLSALAQKMLVRKLLINRQPAIRCCGGCEV